MKGTSIRSAKRILLAASALGMTYAAPAVAEEQAGEDGNAIVVTARRVEERLQDVPISMTVFNQEQLNAANVTSAKDLATYTPGLYANNRYGSDNTTFAIRGFTQELRALPTVGTYFADVVMPRGSGAMPGGDGAGPGALFDLQNVQVLKGPQGTLFGRNVTGGAVLLVPQKPVDRFEGYVEGSAGDYQMRRVQGVLNLPVTDTLRVRFGVDRMKRDGWLRNIGNVGDGAHGNRGMGDVDYWAARASIVGDLSPDVENYTIVSYSNSKSNGVLPKVTRCYPGVTQAGIAFGNLSCDQIARQDQYDFWTVSNRLPDHRSDIEQWQVINTTTWQASDSLTIKSILSYAEFRGNTNLDLYGNYLIVGGVAPGTETAKNVTGFAFTSSFGNGLANAQSTMVGELQFQGHPGDGRLTWQAGLYAEHNDPLGFSGVQSATFTPCADVATFDCLGATPGQSVGTGAFSISKTEFRGYAVYGQASYDLTEQLKLTGGLRYTWDKMDVLLYNQTVRYGSALALRCSNISVPEYTGTSTFPFSVDRRFEVCAQNLSQSSDAPTWVLGLDFKPVDNVLLYGKYSRGYRQGGITIFGADPLQKYDAEKVDTYEIGAKTSWRGTMPGNFNISGFYNNFSNQQLQFGLSCDSNLPNFVVPCASNTALINAGKSKLYGFEAELSVSPFEGFRVDASYGYLKTDLQSISTPEVPPPYNRASPPELGVIPNSQPHKVVVQANYTLPLSETIGSLTVGGNYVYTAAYRTQVDQVPGSGNGMVPSSNLFNLNVTWEDVGGMPVDASFFMTNVTNEKIYVNANDNQPRGFISYHLGEPRMWGARLRYKFGN